MFKSYFSGLFRGGYKIIIGFLKGLLVYTIIVSICSSVFSMIILANDPTYIALIESLETATNIDQIMVEFENILLTNKSFDLIIYLSSLAGFAGGFYMFMHHVSMHSIKYYYNFYSITPLPIVDLNTVYKVSFQKIKKQLKI